MHCFAVVDMVVVTTFWLHHTSNGKRKPVQYDNSTGTELEHIQYWKRMIGYHMQSSNVQYNHAVFSLRANTLANQLD